MLNQDPPPHYIQQGGFTLKKCITFCHQDTKYILTTHRSVSVISPPLSLCASLVTDVELKRLKDAFKRTSGLSYYMTQQCFYREVLGDGVPPKVAEVSHTECHSTKQLE